MFANTTLMNSEITPGNEGISAPTNPNRPMVGQSEYVVNAGLGWSSRSGTWDATLLYNVAGQRIIEAGVGRATRRLRAGRANLVDASLQLPVTSTFTSSSTARTCWTRPTGSTQGGVLRHEYHTGRVFEVALIVAAAEAAV